MTISQIFRAYRFPLILLLGIAIGCVLGLILGPRAAALKPLGTIFLNLLFTAVVPLVFFSISAAVAAMPSAARLGKVMGGMLVTFVATGVVASVLMWAACMAAPPAAGASIRLENTEQATPLSTVDQMVKAVTVSDFPELISKKNLLPLIVMAVLFGLAASMAGLSGRRVAAGLSALSDVMVRLVGIIMLAAPIGLGAYFAALVGEFGPQLLGAYARAMAIYYPVTILYFFLAFTLYAFLGGGGRGVRAFWKYIPTPAATALATGSSVGAIPANLLAAQKIGIPRDVRELVIPIGATIHMDGSCLSAILKITFLFGIFGMQAHGLGDFATAVGVALLSGMVMAGIPGGGFIGEMMIVSLYGFPPEALPILAAIGALVDPPATMVNSVGDTVCSMMTARLVDGPGWMDHLDAKAQEKTEGPEITDLQSF